MVSLPPSPTGHPHAFISGRNPDAHEFAPVAPPQRARGVRVRKGVLVRALSCVRVASASAALPVHLSRSAPASLSPERAIISFASRGMDCSSTRDANGNLAILDGAGPGLMVRRRLELRRRPTSRLVPLGNLRARAPKSSPHADAGNRAPFYARSSPLAARADGVAQDFYLRAPRAHDGVVDRHYGPRSGLWVRLPPSCSPRACRPVCAVILRIACAVRCK